jgi:hypothetical protein
MMRWLMSNEKCFPDEEEVEYMESLPDDINQDFRMDYNLSKERSFTFMDRKFLK